MIKCIGLVSVLLLLENYAPSQPTLIPNVNLLPKIHYIFSLEVKTTNTFIINMISVIILTLHMYISEK